MIAAALLMAASAPVAPFGQQFPSYAECISDAAKRGLALASAVGACAVYDKQAAVAGLDDAPRSEAGGVRRFVCEPTRAPEQARGWTPAEVWSSGYISLGLRPAAVWVVNLDAGTVAAEDASWQLTFDITERRGSQLTARRSSEHSGAHTSMTLNLLSGEMTLYYFPDPEDVRERKLKKLRPLPDFWSWDQRCRRAAL